MSRAARIEQAGIQQTGIEQHGVEQLGIEEFRKVVIARWLTILATQH